MIRFWMVATVLSFATRVSFANTATAETVTTKSLRCGGTIFSATTRRHDDVVIAQSLIAHLKSGRPNSVSLRQVRIFQRDYSYTGPALNSSIEEWKCEHLAGRHFLSLIYICNTDMTDEQIAAYCTVTHEWSRYIDTDGHLLDQGYRPEDPRYRALERNLGYQDRYDQTSEEGGFEMIF